MTVCSVFHCLTRSKAINKKKKENQLYPISSAENEEDNSQKLSGSSESIVFKTVKIIKSIKFNY